MDLIMVFNYKLMMFKAKFQVILNFAPFIHPFVFRFIIQLVRDVLQSFRDNVEVSKLLIKERNKEHNIAGLIDCRESCSDAYQNESCLVVWSGVFWSETCEEKPIH